MARLGRAAAQNHRSGLKELSLPRVEALRELSLRSEVLRLAEEGDSKRLFHLFVSESHTHEFRILAALYYRTRQGREPEGLTSSEIESCIGARGQERGAEARSRAQVHYAFDSALVRLEDLGLIHRSATASIWVLDPVVVKAGNLKVFEDALCTLGFPAAGTKPNGGGGGVSPLLAPKVSHPLVPVVEKAGLRGGDAVALLDYLQQHPADVFEAGADKEGLRRLYARLRAEGSDEGRLPEAVAGAAMREIEIHSDPRLGLLAMRVYC